MGVALCGLPAAAAAAGSTGNTGNMTIVRHVTAHTSVTSRPGPLLLRLDELSLPAVATPPPNTVETQ